MSASHSQFKPICVVFGKNTYARRIALDAAIAQQLGDSDAALNLIRLEGDQCDASTALDEVRTLTLLGGRRVVVVTDADKFISHNRKALEKYTESPCETGCLILVCTGFLKTTRLFKAVRAMGEAVECKPLKNHALFPWLTSMAQREHGKRLPQRSAMRLCDHVGTSQEALASELAKLALYVGDRAEITVPDVDTLVGHYREQTVFAVMDAIASGDARTALREWQQVVATDRAASGRAIGGLAWAVRRLLDARAKLDRGEQMQAVARSMWTDADVFAVRMKRYSKNRLETLLCDLLSADLHAKTGLADVHHGVEKFIVKHSTAAVGV
jgi:DNA polymerase III subunit delta